MDLESMERIPLLSSLPADEKERLARILHPSTVPEGTLLFREGETGDRLCLLLDGQVEIVKALGTEGERLLGVRGPGSFIGEMSLFTRDRRHTASVLAHTPLRILEISRPDFEALLRRHPTLAYEMVRVLSQRLEESENLTIRDLLEKNRQLTQAYNDLKAAQAQLIEKERMDAELEVARSIQRSILPHAKPRLPGFDFGTLIAPVSSVGGDLFDFIPLKGDRLGIAIGDVSGHGVPSAIFMALTYSLLRAEASRSGAASKALRNVNRHLLSISDSGHYAPLLIAADGELADVAVEAGQPLGLFDNLLLDEQKIVIPKGGLLFLFTDGVTEAANEAGQQFGVERLREVLSLATAASPQILCERVHHAVCAYCGAAAPHDDILLVGVRAD
jgi:sigma-B regulation protein RsbU (phosphoserine phosphatase)